MLGSAIGGRRLLFQAAHGGFVACVMANSIFVWLKAGESIVFAVTVCIMRGQTCHCEVVGALMILSPQ